MAKNAYLIVKKLMRKYLAQCTEEVRLAMAIACRVRAYETILVDSSVLSGPMITSPPIPCLTLLPARPLLQEVLLP